VLSFADGPRIEMNETEGTLNFTTGPDDNGVEVRL